ncbi:hypothetical protein ACFY2Q_20045 [Micromonospora sp. NPDC000316]|uniref:hypothetical protein n=1 Tax=Micromonospora sp. NPDC000316 TaxID=3364216 RepID=UPI0036B37CF7
MTRPLVTGVGRAIWPGPHRSVLALGGWDSDRFRPISDDLSSRSVPRRAYSLLGHGRWAAMGVPPLEGWRTTLAAAFASAAPPSSWKVA